MFNPSKLIAWTRVLYISWKVTFSQDPRWEQEREDLRQVPGKVRQEIKTGWDRAGLAVEFNKANPRPSIRIPVWKCCVFIFLPLFVPALFSGVLVEHQDSWPVQNLAWFMMAWLAGSTVVLFFMNRESQAALREWEHRKERYVNTKTL
jgi:hypothetical protein